MKAKQVWVANPKKLWTNLLTMLLDFLKQRAAAVYCKNMVNFYLT